MKFANALRIGCAAAIVGLALVGAGHAQQRPTPTAALLSKELMEIKGQMKMFDNIINNVVERHRQLLSMTNPNLGRAVDAVAAQVRTEMAPRINELHAQIAGSYALFLTEQELKDAIAFYKSPLGRKLLAEEPKALDAADKAANDWTGKLAEDVVAKMRGELRRQGHNPI